MAGRNKVHAWYALRRTLPPWRFKETLAELKKVLPRYKVDEIIVKVDSEEFTHGQPPLKWVKNYQADLFEVKEVLETMGIVYSINPWITVGHNDRGRNDLKNLPGLETVVGPDGTQCKVCACPLSPVWREHVAKVWTLYAETEPHIIWVEDDIRTFNHNPVRYGCFCKTHLKAFSRRVGRRVTRDELVSAILKPGKPHPWRKIYLDMQAEVMIDTVAFLAKVVHAVSPETCLGLMSSGPHNHCLEGRRWEEFALAMGDGQPIYSRPPMGNYNEDSLRGLYYSHDSIKITRSCMPEGTIEQTEVESVPFTQYSKSAAFTFVEMAISFAYGSHGVTMNLFDHCGTPMEDEPVFGQILGAKKRWLNSLAKRAQAPGTYEGVKMLHHEKSSYVKRVPKDAHYGALTEDGSQLVQALESHGVPTTYDDSPVSATSGQVIRAYSDDEIRKMLKGGLLLDGTAAKILVDRGFGPDIGLVSAETPVHIDSLGAFSAEEFFNRKFGGADGHYLTLTIPALSGRPNLSVVKPARKAEVVSCLVDPDTKRHYPCMTAFENKHGGRVVVHALDTASAYGVAFNHTFRRHQLQGATKWLYKGRPPLLVNGGVYPLAFRKECEDFTLTGLFNLTLDPWPVTEFSMTDRRKVDRVERLNDKGSWVSDRAVKCVQSGRTIKISYTKPVPFDKPLMLTVFWK
jgi:hypothetical protein